MSLLIAFVVTGALFCAVDLIWLTLMGGAFYRPHLGDLMRASPNLAASAAFYVIYAAVLTALVVAPAIRTGAPVSLLAVFGGGALFGLGAYATYNLTNLATLKAWPLPIVLVDTAWGTLLTGVVAAASVQIAAALAAR